LKYNGLNPESVIHVGDFLIIPNGILKAPVSAYATARTATEASRRVNGYFIFPTSGRNWGKLHPHNAVDIANSCGTPIYAAAGGTVSISKTSGWNGGYGHYIEIKHPNGTKTRYGHLQTNLVNVGNRVNQGDLIAYMGTTGHSTGCHVHFEVWGATNPFAR